LNLCIFCKTDVIYCGSSLDFAMWYITENDAHITLQGDQQFLDTFPE
jgi:hypothetical protein